MIAWRFLNHNYTQILQRFIYYLIQYTILKSILLKPEVSSGLCRWRWRKCVADGLNAGCLVCAATADGHRDRRV